MSLFIYVISYYLVVPAEKKFLHLNLTDIHLY